MNEQGRRRDQDIPDYKCERCWSNKNINLYQKLDFLGDEARGFVVLCDRCKGEAPDKATQNEFDNLFLRFASVKELLLHYDAEDEAEAMERWKGEAPNAEERDEIPSTQIATGDKNEQVPLGYNLKNGEYDISQDEAEIVREIFENYLSGKTMERIARDLGKKEDNGGKVWSIGKVRAILKDPIYAGYVVRGKDTVKGYHEKIIDKETYNEVQKRMVRNIRNPKYLYKPLILGE